MRIVFQAVQFLLITAMFGIAVLAFLLISSAIVRGVLAILKFIAGKTGPYRVHNFHGGWGDAIYWNRRGVESSGIYGFANGWQICDGDVVLDAPDLDETNPYHPRTIYKAYLVRNVKFEHDPHDMFFADVIYIGTTRLGEILRKDVNRYDLEKLRSFTDYCIKHHRRFGAREVVVYDDEKKTWRSE